TGKKPFVRYWMHVGMLKIDGEKMSKSLGNIITWSEALEMAPAAAWRLYYATNAYRQPMNITEDGIRQAHETVKKVYRAEQLLRYAIEDNELGDERFSPAEYMRRFEERMDDDFDTPGAVAAMMSLINDFSGRVNRLDEGSARETLSTLRKMMDVLGLPELRMEGRMETLVELLVGIRARLREEKRYREADEIRERLAKAGIELHDGRKGTRWFLLP
ncbi:TPA: cysteine--tRNA ligase, partial [Candidatus Micrarchaeota archaeon]|nr:cysteine--tRNA ligase [Candidatus Micrarchaeota archaeon]